MKNLQFVENFSCREMSQFESTVVLGGGTWWKELLKVIAQSAAYDLAKEAATSAYHAVGNTSPSGEYHDAMSSSNHGGIR